MITKKIEVSTLKEVKLKKEMPSDLKWVIRREEPNHIYEIMDKKNEWLVLWDFDFVYVFDNKIINGSDYYISKYFYSLSIPDFYQEIFLDKITINKINSLKDEIKNLQEKINTLSTI